LKETKRNENEIENRNRNQNENKKGNMKGAVVISETLLEAVGVIISFIIIVLVVQLVFQQQTAITYESAFESVARDVSTAIDRAAAAAGSMYIEQPIPKGMQFNLTIDYKTVFVEYGGQSARKSFDGLTYTSPKSYTNPSTLCIIKTANDRRVYVAEGACKCDTKDNVCNPACSLQNKCSHACKTEVPDDVCNSYCVIAGDGICDPDCYRNVSSGVFDPDCVKADKNPDGICSPDSNNIKKGICDKDCYLTFSNGNSGVCDPDCPPSNQITEVNGVKYKQPDGHCYTGCINSTVTTTKKITLVKDGVCDLDCKDSVSICDPDCPDSEACQNKCMKEGEKDDVYPCCDGLIACPGNNVCKSLSNPLSCCGNGICEGRPGTTNGWGPGNKTRWETPYTCQADCSGNAQRSSCSSGAFVSSVCYSDIRNQDGTRSGDKPTWTGNAIAVCSADVQKFLDRRNWDINEVFQTVNSIPPEGYAFDASRYVDACNKVQNAARTTGVNENYTSDAEICCSLDGTGCPFADAVYLGDQCNGIGYCADHAASMLSILRTLGIPDNDVFMTFEIQGANCGRHAFAVMRCDASLKNNPKLWPVVCNGNEGQWISVDATRHFVAPLRETSCVSLGIFWNDKGIYPLTYGKLPDGTNGQKRGYVYATDAICNTANEPTNDQCKNDFAVEHHYDDLCKPYNVDCVVP
jgi:hypothetical protein